MSEELQAERLATWLRGASSEVEGLDPEVVESVRALRPERMPAPRVSVESILAEVRTGPLAANPMPVGASLGTVETVPERSNRPWMLALLGAGGLSGIASIAAIGLVVVLASVTANAPLGNDAPVGRSASAPSPSAMAPAPRPAIDTGAPGSVEKTVAVRAPSASMAPAADVAASGSSGPAEPAFKAKAEAKDREELDAVAFADDEVLSEDDAKNDGMRQARQDRYIPEMQYEGQVPADEPAPSARPVAPSRPAAAPPPSRPEVGAVASRGAAEEREYRPETAAPVLAGGEESKKEASVADTWGDLAERSRRQDATVTHPSFARIRSAVAEGNHRRALNLATRALSDTSLTNGVRQQLYVYKGDAERALGDLTAAQRSYEAADQLR